jgi:hypothetical protein
MPYTITLLAAFLTLSGSGRAMPDTSAHGSGTGVWPGSTSSPYRGWDLWQASPGYGRSLGHRPAVACDSFGRCWQREPSDPFERRYVRRPEVGPPGWAEDLPRSARTSDRFLRPGSGVVCDRASRLCYKDGKVDKSDTQSMFGARACGRAGRRRWPQRQAPRQAQARLMARRIGEPKHEQGPARQNCLSAIDAAVCLLQLTSLAQLFEYHGDPRSQLFVGNVTARRELVGEQPHLNRQARRIRGPCLPDRFVEIREPLPGLSGRVIISQQSGIQRRADFLPLAPEIVQVARR